MIRRTRSQRRGQATVEFALCATAFFMIMFGTVEFARVTQIQNVVRQAAFEGARAGALLDGTVTSATTAATNLLKAVGVKTNTVTISPNPISYNSPTVTVTVSASPKSNGWLTWIFTSSQNISSTISLDREIQSISAQGTSGS